MTIANHHCTNQNPFSYQVYVLKTNNAIMIAANIFLPTEAFVSLGKVLSVGCLG